MSLEIECVYVVRAVHNCSLAGLIAIRSIQVYKETLPADVILVYFQPSNLQLCQVHIKGNTVSYSERP